MRLLGGLTVFMTLLALGSYASLNFEKIKNLDDSPTIISITGEGEVFAVPDIGEFTFSVQAEAADATTAQEASGTKINNIVAFLKDAGVKEEDIKTTNYNLYPKYRYEERVCALGAYCPPGERVQDGFEVSQSISVKVRVTDDASKIITGVGEREATNISGLSFVVDDTDEIMAEARKAAIKDAEDKARILADDLGVRIVRLAGYSESGGNYPQPMYDQVRTMAYDTEESAFGGAELPMGEEQTVVQVTISYEVK